MARKYHRRRRHSSSFLTFLIILVALFLGLTKPQASHLGHNFFLEKLNEWVEQTVGDDGTLKRAQPASTSYGGLSAHDYQKLAQLNFKSGNAAYVVVNHDRSTLRKRAWRVNEVIYSNLDHLNRTSHSNTAFLEARNVANDSLRVRQFIEPTAWHYNYRDGTQIYNRGHLIAYSVSAGIDQDGHYEPSHQSGDQNNPKNLFTQSAFSNQKVQTIFEGKVRQALRERQRVIYQATPIFRGNELMARGINLQALSTNGRLDFNVYLFNVQPGYVFNYQNGHVRRDPGLQVQE